MYCPNCGKEIPGGGRYCPDCGFDVSGDISVSNRSASYTNVNMNAAMMMNTKSEGLTLILAFLVTGLGHIYVGRNKKGIALLVASILCWFFGVSLWASGSILLFPFLIVFILWIYGMYDSYKLAQEYNRFLLDHNGQRPW